MGWGRSQVQASAKGPYTAVQPLTGLASRFSWNLPSFFSLLPPPSHPPFPSPPPWLMESHSHFSSGIAVGSFLHTPALRTTVQRSSSFLAEEFSPLGLITRGSVYPQHTHLTTGSLVSPELDRHIPCWTALPLPVCASPDLWGCLSLGGGYTNSIFPFLVTIWTKHNNVELFAKLGNSGEWVLMYYTDRNKQTLNVFGRNWC